MRHQKRPTGLPRITIAFERRLSTTAAWIVLILAGSLGNRALAGEEITVALASGRTFIGQIDSQTDQDVLWLRVAHGPIVVLRPIEWNRVVRGWKRGKSITAVELQAAAHSLQTERPEPSRREIPAPPTPWPDAPAKSAVPSPPRPALSLLPVTTLEIDAQLGHWTPTVETSGFVVHICPLDSDGQLTAISGTLEVDLVAQRLGGDNTSNDFPSIGRWTFSVDPADFGPSGASYRCPFQAVHPDFDYDLRPLGLVHARLTVPGQGVFEASQALVRIRPYSAIRDRHQQTAGDRFFPVEQTAR